MKFILKKASDCNFKEEIDINTLEDLKSLSDKYDREELIINFHPHSYLKNWESCTQEIKIYDYWIE